MCFLMSSSKREKQRRLLLLLLAARTMSRRRGAPEAVDGHDRRPGLQGEADEALPPPEHEHLLLGVGGVDLSDAAEGGGRGAKKGGWADVKGGGA